MQLNHFPIICQWKLSVAMATKPRDYFSYFKLPLPKQLLYQIRVILLEWFRSCHLKKSFFKIECCRGNQTKWPPVIKHINWVDNHKKIITAKYGSHHFTSYGESAI